MSRRGVSPGGRSADFVTLFKRPENQWRWFLSFTIQWKSTLRYLLYFGFRVPIVFSFNDGGGDFSIICLSSLVSTVCLSSLACKSVRIPLNGVTPMPLPKMIL